MIEVFDSETRQLALCNDREMLAALAAHNEEARKIQRKLAEMYEREVARIRR